MSTTYTPDASNNPSSYQAPEDGELASVASILAFVEGVADKAHRTLEGNCTFTGNKSGFTVATGQTISYQDAVTHTRLCPSNAIEKGVVLDPGGTPATYFCIPGVSGSSLPGHASSARVAEFPLTPPDGATITGVRVRIDPVDGTPGTTKPTLEVRKRAATTGAQTLLGSTVDPTAAGAGYDAAHDITVTGLSEVVDYSAFTYWIRLLGEEGGADAAQIAVLEVELTYTTAAMDKGG